MNLGMPMRRRRVERILAELGKSDLDQHQVAEKAHMVKKYVGDYVKAMLAADLVHIVGWAQPGVTGQHIPVLRAGPGISVPRPPPLTPEQRNERWRAKLEDDPERAERLRAGRCARKRKITPDPLHAWIPVRRAEEETACLL